MLTLFRELCNSFIGAYDRDLRQWASMEYKHDAEYAYNYVIQYKLAPRLGLPK